jgi:hypothetical protein
MAATTIKPYPHVQINVKDNSIATIDFVETLPVHRPLYVMRTKKGPLGEPTWCNTYSEAAALFGAETFDPANKEYFSLASLYLRDTFTRNGAFVTRYLPGTDYTYSNSVLYAVVTRLAANNNGGQQSGGIVQYQKDDEGYVKTAWSDIRQEFVKLPRYSSTPPEGLDPATLSSGLVERETGVQIEFYTKHLNDADFEALLDNPKSGIEGKGTSTVIFPIAAFRAKDPGKYGNDLAYKLFYTPKSNNAGDVEAYGTVFYNVGFAQREDASSTWDAISDIYTRESCAFAANPNVVNPDTGAPMSVDYVLDKSFSDKAHELPVDFAVFEDMLNEVGLIIAAFENDTLAANGSLAANNNGNSINVNDAFLGALTTTEKDQVINYYFEGTGEQLESDLGYKINIISGKNLIGENYDHVIVIKDAERKALYNRDGEIIGFEYTNANTDEKVTLDKVAVFAVSNGKATYQNSVDNVNIESGLGSSEIYTLVSLTDFYNIALTGGKDGTYYVPVRSGKGMFTPQEITGEDLSIVKSNKVQSSDDKAMYDFVKLKLPVIKDRIVESLRFPFTHIFDIGFTMKTKKAICDFLDVRDDFVFIASPQVLYSDGSGRAVTQNAMAEDEANTEALRAYSLLMRESVLYGTDCMRVSIYEHSGHLVNSTYTGVVPHTYWAAVQYSQYGNLTYMSTTEPRGLPFSYNLLFKDQNWTNYRADSQSRVWDEGGNYVQFADMTRLFYPALRTVYRAETSVLIDEWVVAAVVYAKYVARRAWARFSGRNDYASILKDAIKKYIDTELKYLFNGKYTFNVSVYQTAEEQELGYIQHVKISITFGATMRVLDVDIEVNREGFVPEE